MNPSCNLFLIGPTGAGKTSIGRRLAAHYGLPFVDLDQEIERHCGVGIPRVFELEGEAGFRLRERTLLEQSSLRKGVLLATGAGAVLDPDNRRHLAERGFVLWLDTTVEQQLQRLSRDTQRPLLAQGDRRGRLEAMAATRTSLYRQIADLRLLDELDGVAAAAERGVALLDRHWQRQHAA